MTDDKDQNDNIDKITDPLLDDKDFEDLVTAQFQAEGEQDDDLARKKNWNAIEGKFVKEKAPSKNKFTQNSSWLALAAVIALSVGLLTQNNQQKDDTMQLKGDFSPTLNLESFTLSENSKLIPVNEITPTTGSKLIFNITSSEPGYMAFLYSINKKPVEISITSQEIPTANKPMLLEKSGSTFGYQIENNEAEIKFCAVISQFQKDLSAKIKESKENWDGISKSQCYLYRKSEL